MDFRLIILCAVCCSVVADGGGGFFGENDRCEPPIAEGLIVKPFQKYYDMGSSIELSCEKEYELVVRNSSTCTASGFLRDVPQFLPDVEYACRKVPKCYPPFEEGLIVTPFHPSYEIGEEISLSCEEGYELNRDDTKTCMEQRGLYGQYTIGFYPQRSSCRKIQKCTVPLEVGLIVTPFKPFYERGEEISLSCEEGHDLMIANTTVCHKSGFFEGIRQRLSIGGYALPPAKSACKRKPSCDIEPYEGLVVSPVKSFYLAGEEISLSCEDGYYLTGPNTSICVAGYFDEITVFSRYGYFQPDINEGSCKPIPKCAAPQKDGLILSPAKERYEEGEEVSLSCDDGYELNMEDKIVCERSAYSDILSRFSLGGSFSPSVAFQPCRKIVKCNIPVQKGLIVSPVKSFYLEGEDISLVCEEGYELTVAETSTCQATHLHAFIPVYHRSQVGEFVPTIRFGACQKIPKCTPPDQEGLILTPAKDSYYDGEGVSLSCEDGYKLQNAPKTVCKARRRFLHNRGSGSFKPEIKPKACKRIPTCTAPEQEGLIVTPVKDIYMSGDTIELSCEDEYVLAASVETRTCKNGRFNPVIRPMACKHLGPCQGAMEKNSPLEMMKCLAKLFMESDADEE